MLPVIALVGRPNVGKSTLFNRLTRSRDALVADYPGLTRDRQYGFGKLGPIPYLVIDTGGVAGGEEGIDERMVEQTVRALEEADVVLIMVDGREGLTAADEHVADLARRAGKKTWLIVNKAEGLDHGYRGQRVPCAGSRRPDRCLGRAWRPCQRAHGRGAGRLRGSEEEPLPSYDDDEHALRIAVVGRPNVGKSTLINRLIGEDRLVVYDQPGTTRDSVSVPFEKNDRKYELIDTAGIRRKFQGP